MSELLAREPPASPTVRFGIDEALARADWRRRVADAYRDVRTARGARDAWDRWRELRQWLHSSHPQSPAPPPERSSLRLDYFDHDPEARVLGRIEPTEPQAFEVPMSGDRTMRATRMATVHFELYGRELVLGLYWLEGYRGGLFLSFRDQTNGTSTYGGGRSLLDTMKSEDLGMEDGLLVLDFNHAHHPPCFYNHRFSCPLPPVENTLPVAVAAGERVPS